MSASGMVAAATSLWCRHARRQHAPPSFLKHHWLDIVIRLQQHCVVTILLNQRLQSLAVEGGESYPDLFSHMATLKAVSCTAHRCGVHKIHHSIAVVFPCLVVDRQINEI